MTAGSVLGNERLVAVGGRQLAWLLARETRDGHLSVTPAGGAGPGPGAGRFDQQPIEVAAMSDACLRAFDLTGEDRWRLGHEMCVGWFTGDNDLGAVMFDATHRGRLRRAHRPRTQPQSGRRIDAGPPGDDAERPSLRKDGGVNDLGVAVRSGLRIRPNPSRVIARLFIPGQELVGGSESRTSTAVDRIQNLGEGEVTAELASVMDRFSSRHENLEETFERHAERVASFVSGPLSPARRQLLGAVFTHEFSLEGASVCNPSLVADPVQPSDPAQGLRVILSYRSIGEGHHSAVNFRTGVIDQGGELTLAEPEPFPVVASTQYATFDRRVFHARLADMGIDGETSAYVLSNLGEFFTMEDLQRGLDRLSRQRDTRPNVFETALQMRAVAECCYVASFDESTALSRRVLWPATPAESQGLEDARFVRLTEPGEDRYVASYTAFDGRVVSQQLLETTDFLTFVSTPLSGVAATNKGLAIFPRQIDGMWAALSRHDRESNSLAFSRDLRIWNGAAALQDPLHAWELLQIGNCGSPIELAEGWLVLTHGVGPMRTYGIGALLLDLEDPSKVLAQLERPLLVPDASEQDGYVPNVLYSCGSLVHGGLLYLPFGIADQSISYATVPVGELVSLLV